MTSDVMLALEKLTPFSRGCEESAASSLGAGVGGVTVENR